MWQREWMFFEGQRGRGAEGQRGRGSEGQRVRGAEGQRVRGSEGQRVRGAEGQRLGERSRRRVRAESTFSARFRPFLGFDDTFAHGGDQAGEHALHSHHLTLQGVHFFRRCEGQCARYRNLELQLAGRGKRVLQRRAKLAVRSSAASLGDVRSDRDRRATHLVCERVTFFSREEVRGVVALNRELERAWRHLEFPGIQHAAEFTDGVPKPSPVSHAYHLSDPLTL